ncbi:hypothetical protein C482_07119 [Natrialba chahannaoensis JCM 10990]|uniref:Uncharacterized protein n=1 Tax=Natrialba chahannaoensis JCM 10990 TaxID=1227492 RepID=M0AS62_9EURY|nr:hypothetical protein [Natrialba chahannaoensis]ELZ01526.1 hypothetical protein C482_07119 [Natrialba chahannaoensis JCM 10990]
MSGPEADSTTGVGGLAELTDSSDQADLDVGVSTPAAVGLYLAVVTVGVTALVSVATGAATEVLLTSLPTAFTGGVLGGIVLARIRPSLLFRLGRFRWRTLALWLPAPLFAGGALVLDSTGLVPETGLTLLLLIPAAGVLLTGRLAAHAAHDLAVGATVDDGAPIIEWTWYQSGPNPPLIALGVGSLLFAGLTYALSGSNRLPTRLGALGAVSLLLGWAPTVRLPSSSDTPTTLFSVPDFDYARAEIRAYADGLVVEPRFRPSYRRVVPWDRFTGVRLTEDRLVLERRWWPDIRCDRAAIDDVDAVLEAVETSGRNRPQRVDPVTADEPQF